MENEPEKFYDDVKISSVFGSFPCIWNGGRNIHGEISERKIKDILSFYNSHEISIRNTFTNSLLTYPMYLDYIGNLICIYCTQIGEQYNITNSCIINQDEFGKFIQETYPNLSIIYSTTKGLSDINDINKYSQNNLLIPSYTINYDFNILTNLQYPNNIELLCIESGCQSNCPNRQLHEQLVNRINLKLNIDNNFQCSVYNPYWYEGYNNPQIYIPINLIREKYIPLCLNKFKISGRGNSMINVINNIESFINYFVYPQYKDYIRNKLLINMVKIRENLR